MEPDVIEELDALLMKLTPKQVQEYEWLVRHNAIDGETYGNQFRECGCAYGTAFRAVTGYWASEDPNCRNGSPMSRVIGNLLGVSLGHKKSPLEAYLMFGGERGDFAEGSDFHKAVLAHMDGRGIIPKGDS